MTRTANQSCAILGVGFLALGLITTLGIVASWNFGATPHWIFFCYATLNYLIAYGFFSHHYWVLPALMANLVGGAAIVLARSVGQPATGTQITLYILTLCLNVLLVLLAYYIRKRLVYNTAARYAGTAFLLLWVITNAYTLSRELL